MPHFAYVTVALKCYETCWNYLWNWPRIFFPANAPCWRSYDALVLLCNVLHMAPGQGSKLWVEWCFCSTRIIPEDNKHALGCLERGCQDVRQGPMPAHPTRQLLPARRPSRNNLRWAELSVWSVTYFRAGSKVSKIRDANWWQRDAKWFKRLTNNNIHTKAHKHYHKHFSWDKTKDGLFSLFSGM